MRTRFTWIGIITILILGISIFFVGCKDDDLNAVVQYHGQVVYINTTNPFPDLTVKVTDGKNTHCQTQTDAGGMFKLIVHVEEINGNYYLLAGDSTCIPKKVNLGGYGQEEVDLGVIEVEGPALPTIKTQPIIEVTAESAVLGGIVETDGRLAVTARGICYSTEQHPTVDKTHTTDGSGIGEFTSNLKDLEHNTIYYARAYATNRMGTAYGEQVKFTTELGVPVVITDSVYRITAHTAKCKGHVESDGGYPVTKRGTCWSKKPDPTTDDDCTDDGSGIGEFTSTLKDLLENTTYYIRTYATNSTTTTYGEQIIITTLDGLAVVTTDSIGTITATGFTAYGTVVSDCDIPVTARGFCYSTNQYPTIEDKFTTVNKGLGSFRSNISGLEYATTYYVRAYATNETATVYGDQVEVRTLSGLPTVTTALVTNVGSVKATCGGNVIDDGSLSVTARGVCYGTSQQPTIEDLHTMDGKGKGEFTSTLKDLKDKTTYYIRAYATTDAGTAYGEQRTFKTEDGIPTVVLNEVEEPTANSVTCKAKVTGDGGVTVTERGICYSTSQYPTNLDTHVASGNGIGEFTGSLSNLKVNTTYYVRAYAVNSIGVGYSEQKTFTTKDGLATLTTTDATSTATTITTGGNVTDDGGYSVTARGICYSATNAEPTIADDKVLVGNGKGVFNVSITGLTANTTYHLRAFATNENGTAYGVTVTIQTKDGNASVSLGEISNITALTASASVTVFDAGGATLQSCGICWSTNPSPTTADSKTIATGKQLNTAYSCNMSGLQPNTTYYVRGFATTDITSAYSEQRTFKTATGLPTISTTTATATSTIIISGGTISSDGGYSIIARGVCYSTNNSNPTISDNFTTAGTGTGSFSTTITKVSVSTTYYVRAYATNSIGTAYGDVNIVTTENGLPKLTTTAPTLNGTTVISGGQITSDEGFGITARGICYGKLPNPDLSSSYNHTNNGTGAGYFTSSFSLPNGSGKYYIRAYATNANGTSYGDQVEVIQPYDELPSFTFGGHVYKVAPDMLSANEYLSYYDAFAYCENLTSHGYSDWRMPTYDELLVMYQNRSSIGGFMEYQSVYYWSSTFADETEHCHKWICFSNGKVNNYCTSSGDSGNYQSYYYIHVRPIRVDQ